MLHSGVSSHLKQGAFYLIGEVFIKPDSRLKYWKNRRFSPENGLLCEAFDVEAKLFEKAAHFAVNILA